MHQKVIIEYVEMNTTLQVPHAIARSSADVGATNFYNVFFARDQRYVPRLEEIFLNQIISTSSKISFRIFDRKVALRPNTCKRGNSFG